MVGETWMEMSLRSSIGVLMKLLPLCLITSPAALGAPTEFASKQLELVSSPTAAQDCLYFTLVGVSVADDSIPSTPWFAVPRAHVGFKEISAMVMLAKASDRLITVKTRNATACGYIAVDFVFLN